MEIQLQVGTKVLLSNPEGKYLLLRRAVDPNATQKTFQGTWDMPGHPAVSTDYSKPHKDILASFSG